MQSLTSLPQLCHSAKASSWSSSLHFAPVICKPAVKSSTSKPFAIPFANLTGSKSTSTASAFAPDKHEESATSDLNPRTLHIPSRAKVTLTAAPVNAGPSKGPSVFARKGGFLAAHAPERIPGGRSFNSTNPATSTPSLKEKVDSGIPGLVGTGMMSSGRDESQEWDQFVPWAKNGVGLLAHAGLPNVKSRLHMGPKMCGTFWTFSTSKNPMIIRYIQLLLYDTFCKSSTISLVLLSPIS
ncbi:hypothetical protein DFH28DRAFT_929703 [Melampsora americana]|nr:hypothetical protein DFH28DRAFT_929703 [Melampsora americana]